MLENQVIGIAGVFVLTFCLIALYHLIGKIGPRGKRYNAPTKQVNRRPQDRRPDHLPKSSGKDDAWLLWSPELDEPADPSKPGLGEHRDTRGSRLRS
ncbi:MAG TPA: hypothetical protein VNS63_04970 [Blastocatellia bacterium]|nr:hypothetical protein [Blastocatellia bacterium]